MALYCLFFLVFSIAGIVGLRWGVRTRRKAIASENWPTVEGKVVSSELPSLLEEGGTTWKPVIVYGYVVNGTSYLSSRVQFMNVVSGSSTFCDPLGKSILEKYPVGKTVAVHYNPAVIKRSANLF